MKLLSFVSLPKSSRAVISLSSPCSTDATRKTTDIRTYNFWLNIAPVGEKVCMPATSNGCFTTTHAIRTVFMKRGYIMWKIKVKVKFSLYTHWWYTGGVEV